VPPLAESLPQPESRIHPPLALSVADTPLVEYLMDFWTVESEYIKYKRDIKK
jgi:hypothetical protein